MGDSPSFSAAKEYLEAPLMLASQH